MNDVDDTPFLAVEQLSDFGKKCILKGPSPTNDFSVVFEDDGSTGYFYGLDLAKEPQPILDALLIYNVEQMKSRGQVCYQIVWSGDGMKAALFIDHFPHAVFDFKLARGYCRANFPPPNKNFSKHSHRWSDEALHWLSPNPV